MTYLDLITAAANVSIAVFAGIALVVALRQIHISREVSSLSAYESYHLACLKHPEFSTGLLDWQSRDERERECYCTFVLFALMTGERVLKLFPRDKTWIYAVKDDIRIHRDFIGSDFFRGYRDHQDPVIRRMIEEVLSEPVPVATIEVVSAPEPQPDAAHLTDAPPSNPLLRGGFESEGMPVGS